MPGRPHAPSRTRLRATVGFALTSGIAGLALISAWAGAPAVGLVAGGGLALMLLAPILARVHLARLVITGPAEDTAFVGVNHRLELTLLNRGLFTTRDLLVTVQDGRRAGTPPSGHVACLTPGRSQRVVARPRFPERGRHSTIIASVESSFPFGLFVSRVDFELPIDLLVLPRLGRLGPLEQRLPRRGGSIEEATRGMLGNGEFYSLRDWREGEPLRGVAWKLSARRGRLLVRDLISEDRPKVQVILSTWIPAIPPKGRRVPSFERAVSLAGTIVEHLLRNGHRVGLVLAGSEVQSLPLARGRGDLLPLLASLAEVEPSQGEALNVLDVFTRIPRSMVPILVLSGGVAGDELAAAAPSGALVLDVDDDTGIDVFEGMLPLEATRRAATLTGDLV